MSYRSRNQRCGWRKAKEQEWRRNWRGVFRGVPIRFSEEIIGPLTPWVKLHKVSA